MIDATWRAQGELTLPAGKYFSAECPPGTRMAQEKSLVRPVFRKVWLEVT